MGSVWAPYKGYLASLVPPPTGVGTEGKVDHNYVLRADQVELEG